MIADSYGKNVNALYLTYDKVNKRIVRENTAIEGPVPVCSKVF
jgi:hypothetical protein